MITYTHPTGPCDILEIGFQEGAVKEVEGRNGWQNEELIAVLIDRMKFLNGKFPCRENAMAITKLEEALMWLKKRTADRKDRGEEKVELPEKLTRASTCESPGYSAFADAINKLIDYLKSKEKSDGQ